MEIARRPFFYYVTSLPSPWGGGGGSGHGDVIPPSRAGWACAGPRRLAGGGGGTKFFEKPIKNCDFCEFPTKMLSLLGVCEGHVTKSMCFFSRETPRNQPQASPATYFLLGPGPDHPDHDHGGGVGGSGTVILLSVFGIKKWSQPRSPGSKP